jgi:hypothetical protein
MSLTFVLIVAAALAGPANDGWVGISGAPKLMKGHPSVRMVDERVLISIKRKTMVVDCTFRFKNEGPAGTVRMGFPDYDSGVDDVKTTKTTFAYFKSYVDGKRHQTRFLRGDFKAWQVKDVAFRQGQLRTVRNVYEVQLGAARVGSEGGMAYEAHYVLETGASWKGEIGKTEIVVTFASNHHPRPTRLLPFTVGAGSSWNEEKGTVLWQGPSKPKLAGNKITFVRTNWEPTERDDLSLFFHLRR